MPISDEMQDARLKYQKKIVDTFWKNPDARLLLVVNYLSAFESKPNVPLVARPVGFQCRIIRQAEEYMRVYTKVKEILEAV